MNSTNDLILFKDILEKQFHIIKWHPSLEQIQLILNKVNELDESAPISEVLKIIHQVYQKPIEAFIMEGLDTSKARYLLSKLDSAKKEESKK
ncbi:TPA: S-(hydroxymethyl)glutathione dehydrogenase [Proteus mirabilis]|uniref:S-(hydroxymethyl)glutathione dehydrogenase n=1 Tax=Proteus mirabilis TaxID=584 RepID=UPI00228C96CD|nr:S-(hydroxymethyl)glutathione dehydrogenase [Proteus mirabilis]